MEHLTHPGWNFWRSRKLPPFIRHCSTRHQLTYQFSKFSRHIDCPQSQNGRKPLNFVRVGTPKLRKDPIGLLFVISEVHKRIDHGEGRRKFSGRRIPHTLYYIVSANKAANGKFHLQAMYGRTQNLVRNGGSLRPDVLVVPRFVIRGI